mgnify:FL=1
MWFDILKADYPHSRERLRGILNSFREFTPIRELTEDEEELILSTFILNNLHSVYEKTLEFMKPFDEIKRDGLNFVLDFDIDGVPFKFTLPLVTQISGPLGIGEMAGDIFPEMVSTKTKMCVKPSGVMTNGDMMVTILLASKNNQLPTILTLPAYVEKTFPEINMHKENILFDVKEISYKLGLIYKIYRLVEGHEKDEIPSSDGSMGEVRMLDVTNKLLEEYIPEGLLGKW